MSTPTPSTTYPPLVIEYVLEGQQRGYNFTSSTKAYTDETLKFIWRNAMPRGQGWSGYVGAESLKCFPLADGRYAAAQVSVTHQQDESGRRGIRRAVIAVLTAAEYTVFLKQRCAALPAGIQHDVDANLEIWRKTRQLEALRGKIKRAKQIVFSHTYTTPADWQVLDALLLKFASTPTLLPVLRWLNAPLTFTTLALDPREEAALVAIPTDKAKTLSDVPIVSVI